MRCAAEEKGGYRLGMVTSCRAGGPALVQGHVLVLYLCCSSKRNCIIPLLYHSKKMLCYQVAFIVMLHPSNIFEIFIQACNTVFSERLSKNKRSMRKIST